MREKEREKTRLRGRIGTRDCKTVNKIEREGQRQERENKVERERVRRESRTVEGEKKKEKTMPR